MSEIQTETVVRNLTIPVDRLDDVRKLFEARSKAAKRIKLPEPTMTTSAPRFAATADGRHYLAIDVELTFFLPMAGEFEIKGKGEWRPPGVDGTCRNVFTTFDPAFRDRIKPEWHELDVRHDPGTCEECNVRRLRNESLILYKRSDNSVILVGTGCVSKFTGSKLSKAQWEGRARFLTELQREFGSIENFRPSGFVATSDALAFIAQIAKLCATEGYISRAMARTDRFKGSDTTADRARWLLSGAAEGVSELAPALPGPEDYDTAHVVCDWARELTPGRSPYLDRLRAALHYGDRDGSTVLFAERDRDYVAAAFAAFCRMEGDEMPHLPSGPIRRNGPWMHVRVTAEPSPIAPQAAPQRTPFLGPVNQRVATTIRVTRILRSNGRYRGDSDLVQGLDEAGRLVKFWLVDAGARHFQRGDRLDVSGIVRAHGDRYDRTATIIRVRKGSASLAR